MIRSRGPFSRCAVSQTPAGQMLVDVVLQLLTRQAVDNQPLREKHDTIHYKKKKKNKTEKKRKKKKIIIKIERTILSLKRFD